MSLDQGETEQLIREASKPLFIRHPLPWHLFTDGDHDVEVHDSRFSHVLSLFSEDELELWPDVVKKLNEQRALIARLEAALVTAASALEKATGDDLRDVDEEDAILAGLKATLNDLGLADRVPGNSADAGEAGSS